MNLLQKQKIAELKASIRTMQLTIKHRKEPSPRLEARIKELEAQIEEIKSQKPTSKYSCTGTPEKNYGCVATSYFLDDYH